jgi:hypothetical protein
VHVQPADLVGDPLARLVGDVGDADQRPLRREPARAGTADAAGSPGDDRDLSL